MSWLHSRLALVVRALGSQPRLAAQYPQVSSLLQSKPVEFLTGQAGRMLKATGDLSLLLGCHPETLTRIPLHFVHKPRVGYRWAPE